MSNIVIKAFENATSEHRRMRTWTWSRRHAMKYLNLSSTPKRENTEKESDAGGSGNYNERFLMDPLRSIPAILAMRRVPTLCSNGTIKTNCSSCATLSRASENTRPVVLQLFPANIFCPLKRISFFCAQSISFPVRITFKMHETLIFQSCISCWTRKMSNALLWLGNNLQYLKNMHIKIK